MSAAWTVGEFINEYVAALAARTEILAFTAPTVQVLDYLPTVDQPLPDAVIVGYVASDLSVEPASIGNLAHRESVQVGCLIRVIRPGAGSVVAKACRDRAMLILGEVAAQLRDAPGVVFPQVGEQTLAAEIDNRQMSNLPTVLGDGTAARQCDVSFDLIYIADTTRE